MAATREAATSDVAGKPAEVTGGPPAATMATELKSPLDKPLCELTEEDIAQVTREDCRRFLKEKGMRRPSWNKSQAIQQVITLKALLEGRHLAADDDDAPSAAVPSIPAFLSRRPSDAPLPVTVPQISVPRPPSLGSPLPRGEPAAAAQPEASRSLPPPYWRRDPPAPAFSAPDSCCRGPGAGVGTPLLNTAGLPPRLTAEEGEAPAGQLIVFYDGNVNVFDGVTPEKARVIMQLAASPSSHDLPPAPSLHPSRPPQCPEPAQQPVFPAGGGGGCFRPPPPPLPVPALAPPTVQPVAYPHQIPQSSGRFPPHFRESMEEWRSAREVELEGPTSRSASLQRYLEKRKDRFKCKRHVMGPSSSMEIFLSQRMRDQMPNGQLICTSPTQAPRPSQTQTRCNSMDNPTQNLCISIDLNDDDLQEG